MRTALVAGAGRGIRNGVRLSSLLRESCAESDEHEKVRRDMYAPHSPILMRILTGMLVTIVQGRVDRMGTNRARVTARTAIRGDSPFPSVGFRIESAFPRCVPMENLIICFLVQLNLVFGMAGLLWPNKLMPVYGILMFPWPASHRAIRTHGIVAIAGYLVALVKFRAL